MNVLNIQRLLHCVHGLAQEGATGQVAGFWPPVGEGEGVQEAGTVTSTGVDITATLTSPILSSPPAQEMAGVCRRPSW